MSKLSDSVNCFVNYCKRLGWPSEVTIALLCNVWTECDVQGQGFINPFLVQYGFEDVAPPFQSDGGYGIFQFSYWPSNNQAYNGCKGLTNCQAIQWQIDFMVSNAKSGDWFTSQVDPQYNLSWNQFITNSKGKSVAWLTKCFMMQYERPGDQSQDRYAKNFGYIKAVYDFSTYDKNGNQNSNNDPTSQDGPSSDGSNTSKGGWTYVPSITDCGGNSWTNNPVNNEPAPPSAPPSSKPDPSNPQPPDTSQSKAAKYVDWLSDHVGYHIECDTRNSSGWYFSQCVDIVPAFAIYCGIGSKAKKLTLVSNNKIIRPQPNTFNWIPGNAWPRGVAMRDIIQGINSPQQGINTTDWVVITNDNKIAKGDILFYPPTANNSAGHVAIAIDKNNRYGLNEFNNDDPITKRPIGNPSFALRYIK